MAGFAHRTWLLITVCAAACTYFPDHHLVHPRDPPAGVVTWEDRFTRDRLRIHVRGARPQSGAALPAVLVHPHGGKSADDMQGVVWDLAGRGYVAIAADYERFIDGAHRRNMFVWRSQADATAIVEIARGYP